MTEQYTPFSQIRSYVRNVELMLIKRTNEAILTSFILILPKMITFDI